MVTAWISDMHMPVEDVDESSGPVPPPASLLVAPSRLGGLKGAGGSAAVLATKSQLAQPMSGRAPSQAHSQAEPSDEDADKMFCSPCSLCFFSHSSNSGVMITGIVLLGAAPKCPRNLAKHLMMSPTLPHSVVTSWGRRYEQSLVAAQLIPQCTLELHCFPNLRGSRVVFHCWHCRGRCGQSTIPHILAKLDEHLSRL